MIKIEEVYEALDEVRDKLRNISIPFGDENE